MKWSIKYCLVCNKTTDHEGDNCLICKDKVLRAAMKGMGRIDPKDRPATGQAINAEVQKLKK